MNEKQKSFNAASLTYFFIVVLFVILRLLSSFGLLKFMGKGGDYFFTIIIQIVLLFGGSIFIYSALKKQKIKYTFQEFTIKKVSGKVVGLSFLLGVVVFLINIFVSSAFNGFIELLGYEHTSQSISSYSFASLLLNLLFTAVLPGICEEVAHRGMLLRSYSSLGPWKAIMLSALMFGLLHVNIEQFFYATIIGIFLGVITIMSNSIIPAMIIHFINNALSTYLLFSEVNGMPLGNAFLTIQSVLTSNLFIGILLSFCIIVVLLYLGSYLFKIIVQNRLKEDITLLQQQFTKEIQRQRYLMSLENSRLEAIGLEPVEDGDIFAGIKEFAAMLDEPAQPPEFKPSKYGKLLTIVTVVLGVVLTIFTFVWGVL